MSLVVQIEYGIKDVWNSNLEEEFKKIRYVIQRYRFVVMVCELFCNFKFLQYLCNSFKKYVCMFVEYYGFFF